MPVAATELLSASTGLAPVWRPDARLLILGSLPGQASLKAAQYYAHTRNQFWPLMQALFAIDSRLPYADRLLALQQQQVALWDLIQSAKRSGSLDSAIDPASVRLNDFACLLTQLPHLQAIWLNGGTAYRHWQQLSRQLTLPVGLQVHALPSTSPAHASQSFAQKLQQWQQAADLLASPTT